jgi:hypothetical protein
MIARTSAHDTANQTAHSRHSGCSVAYVAYSMLDLPSVHRTIQALQAEACTNYGGHDDHASRLHAPLLTTVQGRDLVTALPMAALLPHAVAEHIDDLSGASLRMR